MTNTTTPGQPLWLGLNDQLGQTAVKLRERGNAMRCHPVANGTIAHTEEAGELLCDVASLIEQLAAERERLLSMPNLMHACDALGAPADGEHCDLLRRALYRA